MMLYLKKLYLLICAIFLWNTADVQSKYIYQSELQRWIGQNKIIATWEQAKQNCDKAGAILASPINEQLLKYMRSYIAVNGHRNSYFIGMKVRLRPETQYVSVEGIELDDMPDAVVDMIEQLDPLDGNCLSMNRDSIQAEHCWHRLPYICYTNKTTNETMPGMWTTQHTTPTPDVSEATHKTTKYAEVISTTPSATTDYTEVTSTASHATTGHAEVTLTTLRATTAYGEVNLTTPTATSQNTVITLTTPHAMTGYTEKTSTTPQATTVNTVVTLTTPRTTTGYAEATLTTPRATKENTVVTSTTPRATTGYAEVTLTTPSAMTGYTEVTSTTPRATTGYTVLTSTSPSATTENTVVTSTTPRATTGYAEVNSTTPRVPTGYSEVTSTTPRATTGYLVVTSTTPRATAGYVVMTSSTPRAPDCNYEGYKYYPQTDSCYKVYFIREKWVNAKFACESEGGYLVILNDANEAKTVQKILRELYIQKAWTGLHDETGHGNWRSVQGHYLKEIYHQNRFLHFRNMLRCAAIHATNGVLYEFYCTEAIHFVCERDIIYFNNQ